MSEIEVLTLNKKVIKDFAFERNELLRKSKSKWVLFLDADEKLSSPIKNLDDKYNGYYLNRKNYFLNCYVGTEKIIRLGKRNIGMWKRGVHEVWNIKGKIGFLPNYIIHNTAYDLSTYILKMNKYSDIHAKANFNEGKRSSIFKIIFYPSIKFVFTLINSKSIVFSITQSLHSFLSWTKLYFLQF